MDFSKLNKRVELKAKTVSQDAVGEEIETWTGDAYATIWAEIQPLNGRELETAQQVHPQVDYKITIRYHPQVTAEHRVYWRSRIFEITAIINPSERGVMQALYCKEIPAAATSAVLAALAPYCVAHYKMNDNADNTVVLDSSGNGHHGTSVRNTSLMHVDGKTGTGALNFNGTTDYIDLSTNFQTVMEDSFSIPVWFKVDSHPIGDDRAIFGALTGPLGRPWVWFGFIPGVSPDAFFYAWYLSSLNDPVYVLPEFNTWGDWVHAVMVLEKLSASTGRMSLYINGSLFSQSDITDIYISDFTGIDFYIGAINHFDGTPTEFFLGSIDNLMLFNKALTQADVTALYNKGYGTENFL